MEDRSSSVDRSFWAGHLFWAVHLSWAGRLSWADQELCSLEGGPTSQGLSCPGISSCTQDPGEQNRERC